MRARAGAITLAVLALSTISMAASRAATPTNTASPQICTWGGTPANPTGRVTVSPGLTNTPSAQPDKFVATGEVSGGAGCTGTRTDRGAFDSGATCETSTFAGRVEGVPGVATVRGNVVSGVVQESFYDHHGNLVGSDQADVLTAAGTGPDSPFFTCGTPGGTTGGPFSDTIEHLSSRHAG